MTEHPYPRPQNNTGAGTSANAKKNKNQKNQPDVQALIGSWPETVTPGYTPLSLLSLDGQEKGRGKGKEKEKAVGASKGGEEGSEEGGKGRMKLDREEKSRFVQEVRVGGTNDGRRRGWGTEKQLLLLFSISFLLFIFLFFYLLFLGWIDSFYPDGFRSFGSIRSVSFFLLCFVPWISPLMNEEVPLVANEENHGQTNMKNLGRPWSRYSLGNKARTRKQKKRR